MTKNMFESIAKKLSMKHPNRNVRSSLDWNYTSYDVPLKKNKSFFSAYMFDGFEVFLGEVNYDISSLPVNKLWLLRVCIMDQVRDQLIDFLKSADSALVEKLRKRTNDCCHLRYIVNPDTEGSCLSFECSIDLDRGSFIIDTLDQHHLCFGQDWLDYWNDRKAYFADND